MQISVRTNLREFTRDLTRTHSQMIYAEMLAVNATAADVVKALPAEMRSDFDRPTPFTLNAFRFDRASKQKLMARVKQKDAAGSTGPRHWLETQEAGGLRPPKAFEIALAARLGLPTTSTYFVPGSAATINSYGNISAAQLRRIMSDLTGTGRVASATSRPLKPAGKRKRQAPATYFVLRSKGSGEVNIMMRRGRSLGVVLTSVTRTAFTPRFDFYGDAERTARATFGRRLGEAVTRVNGASR
ncbi:hypothetical protein [Methylobrevis pamukkalensis]|uniref:Uncharacterized protein n=1 Tax=Methylobrevis pamukkalensis TaxID=1439726 RepID=A0A1E3H1W2_9HYPH|nr:hypothetical protein [Methylobrevis pamukkalensis]ODN69541.1 hypothetical protein A6302_03135 [Methylobrevis pamukkalensis]